MKIFLYKLVITLFGIFLLYEFTIGHQLKYYERNLKILITKEYAETIKQKLRNSENDNKKIKRILKENGIREEID